MPTLREMTIAVATELPKALAGMRLPNWQSASYAVRMDGPAADDQGAAFKSAYWLAVASRVLGNRTLAFDAQKNGNIATVLAATPWIGSGSSKVAAVMQNAAARIRYAAGSNANMLELAGKLESYARKGVITGRQSDLLARQQASGKSFIPDLPKLPDFWGKYKIYVYVGGALLLALAIGSTYLVTRTAVSGARAAKRGVEAGGKWVAEHPEAAAKMAGTAVGYGARAFTGPVGAARTVGGAAASQLANPHRRKRRRSV